MTLATNDESGEHVVDVGCGTGNASLLAAARGAQVTGVDPSERLIEVARVLAKDGNSTRRLSRGRRRRCRLGTAKPTWSCRSSA
ncbi:MAG: class I SAM-dependent methyltransferase [Actinomycetota bacterium]|nr:class I SAM-dependent methyltransferase [Actinomycetota bacterium]